MADSWELSLLDVDRLQIAITDFQGSAEDTINEVLHNEAGDLIQEKIKLLMPVSGANWKGKKSAAKFSNSLRNDNGHLSVTVRTAKSYQYLYFPDDGSTTRRHAGNQRFFARGGEDARDEVIDRCINKLVEKF